MKSCTKYFIIVVIWYSIFSINTLSANNFYISPSGSNTTGNGSIGSPWQTIEFAIENVNPGDALYLREGVYNEQLISVRSGTANAYITISNYNNENVYIDGTGVDGRNGLIIDHSFIKFSGFTVRNWEDVGIWLRNCQFNELLNLKITAVSGCIALTGTVHDFIVDSCVLYDYYGGAGGSGFDATPYGTDSIYNGVIRNSKAYLTTGAFDNCDGFALGHEGISRIHFYNCEVYGVGDGFDISGKDILLERCSSHNCNYGGGYKLWRESVTLINCIGYDNSTNVELDFDFPTQKGVKARLINCTFFGCRNSNVWIENSAGGSTLELFNCILAGGENTSLNFDGENLSLYKGDYNLFHTYNAPRMVSTSLLDFSLDQVQNGEWTTASGQDAHSQVVVNSNTIFMDTLGIKPDLHLKVGSLAINNGTNLPDAPSFDFDNCPRNVRPIDIGAHEFGACGSSGISQDEFGNSDSYRLNQNYPNPFNKNTIINYQVPVTCHVTLKVYDMLGQEIVTLMNGVLNAGSYDAAFDATGLPEGVYFFSLQSGKCNVTKKLILTK